MCALLINIKEGDEVIIPSYTFVSTANAFVLRGARIIFADSSSADPNIDAGRIEQLITNRTKAIVVVHYAGISCDMERILSIASRHGLFVIEDAAQAIESCYQGKPLGSIGHLGCFSFHETKNIISGEGGALLINDPSFIARAEILWEKGTNRSAFFRGEISKYNWIDVGSSYLPSEITAAFLYAQLEDIENIQKRRLLLWNIYYENLKDLEEFGIQLPRIPAECQHNAHLFYLVCKTGEERTELLEYLNTNGVNAIFHYLSLHRSPYYTNQYKGEDLSQSDRYESCLLRLPLYFELKEEQAYYIIKTIKKFFNDKPGRRIK
jgi:dTDP-4-amino-4,6-dideoxygalactose transaminase